MPIRLYPLVTAIGHPTAFHVEGLTPGTRYAVQVRARRQLAPLWMDEDDADQQGRLRVPGTLAARGEHTVDVYTPAGERLARLSVYALPPEAFARRPLRCDMHIHTLHSDGRSSPAEMIVRGRELGLDVAVITDHNRYGGSLEAVAARDELGLDLITMPGEEVSGPDWHVLSIAASASIYDQLLQAFDLAGKERPDQEARLSEADALRWAIEAIHRHGGRAYLAHPYWSVSRGFHLPAALYDWVLAEGILDGLELLGDVDHEDNLRSLARYVDLRAAGENLPVLGNSDTHRRDHTYGAFWTLVLAETCSAGGVLDAIASGWSVACTTSPLGRAESVLCEPSGSRGKQMVALGTFELVDYAYFLEQHFFPLHDALCAEEAALAYRAWRGDPLPAGAMVACKERMQALFARCWDSTAMPGQDA
jgi:hypothetical protein